MKSGIDVCLGYHYNRPGRYALKLILQYFRPHCNMGYIPQYQNKIKTFLFLFFTVVSHYISRIMEFHWYWR